MNRYRFVGGVGRALFMAGTQQRQTHLYQRSRWRGCEGCFHSHFTGSTTRSSLNATEVVHAQADWFGKRSSQDASAKMQRTSWYGDRTRTPPTRHVATTVIRCHTNFKGSFEADRKPRPPLTRLVIIGVAPNRVAGRGVDGPRARQ